MSTAATTVIIVIATLGAAYLGARVGGHGAYRAAVDADKDRREAETRIKRKDEVYMPLRDELVATRHAMVGDTALSSAHIGKVSVGTYPSTPSFHLWATIVEDDLPELRASREVRSRRDAVESARDDFNRIAPAERNVIKNLGEAIVAEMDLPPPFKTWHAYDFPLLVRGRFDKKLVIVDGTSSVGPTEHHDSFVERWTADLLAQASAKRVAEADRVVTESVNAAIDALGSAITRIATKYERATAED